MDKIMQDLFDKYIECANAITELFADLTNLVVDALFSDELAEMLQAIKSALDVEKRNAERAKWRITVPNKPNALMLDRRMSIHRCRNAI